MPLSMPRASATIFDNQEARFFIPVDQLVLLMQSQLHLGHLWLTHPLSIGEFYGFAALICTDDNWRSYCHSQDSDKGLNDPKMPN